MRRAHLTGPTTATAPPSRPPAATTARGTGGGWTRLAAAGAAMALLGGCAAGTQGTTDAASTSEEAAPAGAAVPGDAVVGDGLPGMPPVADPKNIYADAGAGMLSPAAQAAKPLVYVPHNSGSVWVIDPATLQVIEKFPAGIEVQHVIPLVRHEDPVRHRRPR